MQRGSGSKQPKDSRMQSFPSESSFDEVKKTSSEKDCSSSSEKSATAAWNEDSLLTLMAAWARRQVPSLYIRMGPYICVVLSIVSAILAHLWQNYQFFRKAVVFWLVSEASWYIYFKTKLMYQLTLFRAEDAEVKMTRPEIDHILDNIVFLIRKNPSDFWSRATGATHKPGGIPPAAVRCYLQSVLFILDGEGSCYSQPEKDDILNHAFARLEEATPGGFAAGSKNSFPSKSTVTSSLIKAWRDDDLLFDVVQHTPILMLIHSFLVRWSSFITIWIFGWRREYICPDTALECWIMRRKPPTSSSSMSSQEAEHLLEEAKRPIILFPGAGFGLTSFLPIALLLQFTLPHRTIVLFRFPWVEMCIPWTVLPQWSQVVRGILTGLNVLGLGDRELDLMGHSYGTAVANRFLRELCRPGAHNLTINSHSSSLSSSLLTSSILKYPKIHSMSLFDPIVLGGAQTGLSSFIINTVSPDLSFAFCGNRAGVSIKEVINYDPRKFGQCLGGMNFYVSAFDVLLDVKLARYILLSNVDPNLVETIDGGDANCTRLITDNAANSFHGRWLVEIWFLGPLWKSPCSLKSLKLLYKQLQPKKT